MKDACERRFGIVAFDTRSKQFQEALNVFPVSHDFSRVLRHTVIDVSNGYQWWEAIIHNKSYQCQDRGTDRGTITLTSIQLPLHASSHILPSTGLHVPRIFCACQVCFCRLVSPIFDQHLKRLHPTLEKQAAELCQRRKRQPHPRALHPQLRVHDPAAHPSHHTSGI